MKRKHCPVVIISLVLFVFFASGGIVTTAANVVDDLVIIDDLAQEQTSVRELMQLDTQIALAQAKTKLKNANRSLPLQQRPVGLKGKDALKLVAIYGVGKKLLAEVLIGSQPMLYMRGHPLPIGVKDGAAVFALREIDGTCIQLERKDESHTLCLPSKLAAGG